MSDVNESAPNGQSAESQSANESANQPRRMRSGRSRLGGALFGLWIVLLGVLFLLQNLGVFYIGHLWQFWPVILIGLGLSRLISTHRARGRIWGGFVAGVGTIFLLSNLGYLPHDVWRYLWPVALILWGIMIMFRKPCKRFRWDKHNWERNWHERHEHRWKHEPTFPPPANPTSPPVNPTGETSGTASSRTSREGFGKTRFGGANRLDEYAILGGVRRRIDSQEFEGGEATSMMGGIELDLSGAGTKLDEVVIEANAFMGGVEIRVPEYWSVTVQGVGILGGYDDSTRQTTSFGATGAKRPHLIITGHALLGGVHVRN